jgi:hypothetical protein
MTKPYGDAKTARVLIIGHDPRLQTSDTIAPYALFADYFFRPDLKRAEVRSKHGLAEAVFHMMLYLTAGLVEPEKVLVTNLCNQALPHAPPGKNVLITEPIAQRGIEEIKKLLVKSDIRVILAMSQQVNYWIQELDFCANDSQFLIDSEPKAKGIEQIPPYFEPRRPGAFLRVCGREFKTQDGQSVFPVLHAKHWPLKRGAKAYVPCYIKARVAIASLLE